MAGVDLAERLRAWREAGFTPAQAMMIYDEMRRFGHGSCRREPVSDTDQQWDAMRLRHCERLLGISTVADWQAYLDASPLLVMGKEATNEEKQSLLDQWVARNGNHKRIERNNIIQRVSRSFSYRMPPQWEAWQELDLGWDDLEAAIANDRTHQPKAPSMGMPAEEAIGKAVAEAALRGVEWGMVDSTQGAFNSDLAHNIEQANSLLQARTGWAGGVLGLNGRMTLRLGLCDSGVGGSCGPDDNLGNVVMDTASYIGWGAVAHEWLHGLDFVMGHAAGHIEEMASHLDKGKNIKHWKTLLANMIGHRFDHDQGIRVVDELNDGFARRWSNAGLPEGMLDALQAIRQERLTAGIGPDSRKSHLDKLSKMYAAKSGAKNSNLRAEIAITELELLEEQARLVSEGSSIWIQFAKRFQENVVKHHPNLAEEWNDYFLQPSEQAAHSFEATFGQQGAFITDVDPETSSLRYPLPSEAMGQSLAWRRFFKGAASWWEQQAPAAGADNGLSNREPTSLSQRIDARRAAAEQNNLPIAARTRAPTT